jgi:hypothetical protein
MQEHAPPGLYGLEVQAVDEIGNTSARVRVLFEVQR